MPPSSRQEDDGEEAADDEGDDEGDQEAVYVPISEPRSLLEAVLKESLCEQSAADAAAADAKNQLTLGMDDEPEDTSSDTDKSVKDKRIIEGQQEVLNKAAPHCALAADTAPAIGAADNLTVLYETGKAETIFVEDSVALSQEAAALGSALAGGGHSGGRDGGS